MKKSLLLVIFITLVFIMLPFFMETIIAQPPPPKPKDIPLDGGLFSLLVAGLIYGGRKIYKEEKKKRENKQ